MLSAYDEHTKQKVIEKWHSEDEEFNQIDNLSICVTEISAEIVKRIKLPKEFIAEAKKKIEAKLKGEYFFKDNKPKLDIIAEEGIEKEANVDDCSLEEVFHVVAIIEFIQNPENFLPEGIDSEDERIDIPFDYDDFRTRK